MTEWVPKTEATKGSIKTFIIGRLLFAIPTIFLIIVLSFVLIHTAPGDPVYLYVGPGSSPEYVAMMRHELGLDKPLYVQFIDFIWNVLHGNFGTSDAWIGTPVTQLIMERLPATLLLMSTAMVFALVFGILLGATAARYRGSFVDKFLTSTSMIGYSMPVFWLAQLIMYTFAIEIGVFPAGGMTNLRVESTGIAYIGDILYHLALPALNLGLIFTAMLARLVRAEVMEALSQDYITTARAKGCSENAVVYGHALRNSLLSLTTMMGIIVGTLFAGAVFTETVFSWSGLGRLLYDSLFSRDYPVMLGLMVLVGVTMIIAQVVTDIIYSIIDPRIRLQ